MTIEPHLRPISPVSRTLPTPVNDTFGPSSDQRVFPVVGVGASAGGLDACRAFVSALPHNSSMAFILVQHLDPHHESMMADLLADHSALPLHEAVHGTSVEQGKIYVIPSGTYLSVVNNVILITPPHRDQGPRMPVDVLLASLAADYGSRAVGIILSGTGTDGSQGITAIRQAGGFTLVSGSI